jgi:hypothetical protein
MPTAFVYEVQVSRDLDTGLVWRTVGICKDRLEACEAYAWTLINMQPEYAGQLVRMVEVVCQSDFAV